MKSRKRSVASSGQLERIVFFLDRSLGSHFVAEALRSQGYEVLSHEERFAADAQDADWLAEAIKKALPRMARLARELPAPFIARVYRNGKVNPLRD